MGTKRSTSRPWAAYARLSVDKDESASIEGQKAVVDRWAKAHGHALVWFVDEGVSGSKAIRRPQRDDLEARLSAGEFAGVVVKAVDRLARSTRDFLRLADTAAAAGASIVVVESGLDTGTDTGRLMLGMLAQFAEFEAAQIGSRQRISQEVRRQQGRSLGRPPYGFTNRKDESGAWRIINTTEAKAVRQLARWITSGLSLQQVAEKANEKALPIRPQRNRKHDFWTGQHVSSILRNPAINGQVPRGDGVEVGADGRPIRHEHLQILDNTTWAKVQEALDHRSAHRFSPATHEPLLLSSVMVCAACNGHMGRSTANKGFVIYRCTNGSQRKCPRPVTISAAKIETFINDLVAIAEDVIIPVTRRQEDPELQVELAEVTATVERIVASMATAAPDEVAALAGQLTRLKEQQAVLRTRIDSEPVVVAEDLGYSPAMAWRDGDEATRRELVPHFFRQIKVLPAQHNSQPVEDRLVITSAGVDGSDVTIWTPGARITGWPMREA